MSAWDKTGGSTNLASGLSFDRKNNINGVNVNAGVGYQGWSPSAGVVITRGEDGKWQAKPDFSLHFDAQQAQAWQKYEEMKKAKTGTENLYAEANSGEEVYYDFGSSKDIKKAQILANSDKIDNSPTINNNENKVQGTDGKTYLTDAYSKLLESNSSAGKSDVIGVIYLNDKDALGAGHSALAFVFGDGSVEYYSFGALGSQLKGVALGEDVPARVSMTRMEAGSDALRNFLSTDKGQGGIIDYHNATANVSKSVYGDGTYQIKGDISIKEDQYDRYILIPINNQGGQKMLDIAKYIYNNPSYYNLIERNCNHIAQSILSEGGVSFAPVYGKPGDSDLYRSALIYADKFVNGLPYFLYNGAIPNTVYETGVEMAKQKGWYYGDIYVNTKK